MEILPLATVGVVADTHVPDRVRNLHPGLLPGLKAAGVDMILHAGDISSENVIVAMEDIAPVRAVGGNRDFSMWRRLPWIEQLVIAGVPLTMMHGHGNFWRYLWEKVRYVFQGYRLEGYLEFAHRTAPNSKVVVFGHTHFPENTWLQGTLMFNPGSAGIGRWDKVPPSYGILRFYPDGEVIGEIIALNGAQRRKNMWKLLD